jgi:C-terminal processing protease CtpA/Prc
MEEYLVGHFFDREVKIGSTIRREKIKERIAKPQKDNAFKGDLIVLIDSHSASASEIFSRIIQIEKRGKVVGDVSAGAVMTSIQGTLANARGVPGYETISLYGMSITVADVIMSDGNRLERIGVIPDYPFGPTGKALAEKSDPVLAYAAKFFGAGLTAEEAGKFYFINKKEENEEETKNDDDGSDN